MIDRRGFVAATAGLSGVSLLSPFAALARTDPKRDLVDRLDPLETMVRLRSRIDGVVSMAWLEADREIVFDGEIYPFCKLHNLMLTSFHKVGDAFIAKTFEVSYYCDPKSGELLDTADMPGSREPAKVPIYRAGPSDVRYKASQDEKVDIPSGPTAGSQVHHLRTVAAPIVQAERLYLKSDEYVRVYSGPDRRLSIFYRDWMTWQADVDAVLDLTQPDVPSSFGYTAMTDLRPWTNLDPARGHTVSSGIGAKVHSPAQLPDRLVRLLSEHDPRTLDDPKSYFQ